MKLFAVISSVCCCPVASMFFFLFRNAYQSVSNQESFLINIIFYYLSILYQCVNVVSTVFILSTLSDVLDKAFSLLLFNVRQWLLISILAALSYISFARVFSHFWMNNYLEIKHSLFGKISRFLIIFHASSYFVFRKVLCNSYGFSNEDDIFDQCTANLATFVFSPPLLVVLFSNVLIISHNIFNTNNLSIKSLKNSNMILPLPFNNTIVSSPNCIELQTISSTIYRKPINDAVPTHSHNITFTTGLITIILNISIIIITTAIAAVYAPQEDNSWLILNNMIDIIFTTLIPLYWILANEELTEFCIRFIKRIGN